MSASLHSIHNAPCPIAGRLIVSGKYSETFRKNSRDILHAVNSNVNLIPQKGILDFLYKQTLAAYLCKRDIEYLVACSLYLLYCNCDAGMPRLNLCLHMLCLPHGKLAPAAAYPDFFHPKITLFFPFFI